jgi:hypothetical protein
MPLQGCILLQGLVVESTAAVGEVLHPFPIETPLEREKRRLRKELRRRAAMR